MQTSTLIAIRVLHNNTIFKFQYPMYIKYKFSELCKKWAIQLKTA